MVSTAAECALRASTMSDEFFTKGTSPSGYTTAVANLGVVNTASSRDNTLRIDIGSTAEGKKDFQYYNPYLLAYNINTSGTSDADTTIRDAYEAMFTSDAFKNWAKKVLELQFVTPDIDITVADTIVSDTVTAPTNTYRIPKLCTMGASLFSGENMNIKYTEAGKSVTFAEKLYSTMYDTKGSNGAGMYGSLSTSLANKISKSEKVKQMLSTYDYWDYARTSHILDSKGEEFKYTYYLTPTALGLTYIDTNVLDIIYRSNLDLLMRGKYLLYGKLDDRYNSVIPYTYFPDTDADFASTWAQNVVNNGSFYYVRGKLNLSSNGSSYSYGWKPTVDYIYITLTPKDRAILNINQDTAYPDWLSQSVTIDGTSVPYYSCINAMLSKAISPTTTLKTLSKKYTGKGNYNIILAQVTFASEFIIPYQSSPMRGMAEHFGSTKGTYSEQDLNCFTVLNTSSVFANNAKAHFGNNRFMQFMQTVNNFLSTGKSLLTNNAPYVYTTYYAIAD